METERYNNLTRPIAQEAALSIQGILRGSNCNLSDDGRARIEEALYKMLVDFRQVVMNERISDGMVIHLREFHKGQ